MIVRDEERFLDACLRSVRGIVDEIVVADTGSTDATVSIANRHGAKVVRHVWNDDFSAAPIYDHEVRIDAAHIAPQVTWGTSPEDVVPITGVVPDPNDAGTEAKRTSMRRALDYMGLVPGTKMIDIPIDNVFIGSCTNSAWKICGSPPTSCGANRSHHT
jgi:homoaconitase/3-isopropylmalate dehydratase large subunit